MLTFFCIPKAFEGRADSLQRNAMRSWMALRPRCEIFVYGDETGIAQACAETRARHFPQISRNEFGTPLLDHAFRVTAQQAGNEWVCYVNSDILFFPDLLPSIQAVSHWLPASLIVGRRWNFDVGEPFVFQEDERWREEFRGRIRSEGVLYDGFNVDYFIYPRALFAEIPPFAVGRPGWDNWMIYEARRRQIPVIDATEAIFAAHQNHDYAHTPEGRMGGKTALWRGKEARRNRELAGDHLLQIEDATHILTAERRLKRKRNPVRFFQRWQVAEEIHPDQAWLLRPVCAFLRFLERCDHAARLWLLRRGVDVFPHRYKRQGRIAKT